MLALLACGFSGCGPASPPASPEATERVNRDAELSVCFQNHNFNSFIPKELHFYNEAQLLELAFNTLVQADHAGHLSPDLATSWEVSKDRLDYTFHLRPNVRFSNGKRLTSRDVAFTLEELILRGSLDNEFYCITGAADFSSRKRHSISGLDIVHDYCLRIHLDRPFNLFLHLLASKAASVIPADYAGKSLREFRLDPIGTGPFKLNKKPETVTIKHQNFHRIEFLRRNDYFAGPAPVKRIIVFLPLESPRANTLYSFDIFLPPEGFGIDTIPTQSHKIITSAPDTQVFLAINPSPANGEALSENWRHILQYGIDRERLIRETGMERTSQAAHTIMPISLFGYNRYFRLDPERAVEIRRRLPQGATATLPVTIYPRHVTLVSALNRQLAAFGLKLESVVLPLGPYYQGMRDQRRRAMIVRGICDYPHAFNFLSQLYKSNGLLNYFNHSNPEIRELIGRLPLEDIRSQARLLEKIAGLCTEDAWYIPLYFLSDQFILRKYVNHLSFKFGGIIDFHAVEVNHESINGSH